MKFNIFELGIFSFNSYVYYLTRAFLASTRAFNFPTRAFNLVIRAFSLLTCGFKLVNREFELVPREFNLETRGFELVTRVLLFHAPLMKISVILVVVVSDGIRDLHASASCPTLSKGF